MRHCVASARQLAQTIALCLDREVGVRLSAGSRLRHVMEGIPRGEAESPKAMPWQGCGCALCMDVRSDCDGIPSSRLGSFGAKRQTDASGAEGELPA